jgi:Uma2 family endonuclease
MTQAIASLKDTNQSQALTDEQFMALPEDDNLYEYVNGELIVVANSGVEHGYLALTLG